MADLVLRRLERRALLGGPRDGARVLALRLRHGLLSRERIALAAHLGHPAARLFLDAEAPPLLADWESRVRALGPWRKEASVRAAVAVAAFHALIDFPLRIPAIAVLAATLAGMTLSRAMQEHPGEPEDRPPQ